MIENTAEVPQCRNTDPITSRIARKSDTLDIRILNILMMKGPQTCWELVELLNMEREMREHDPDKQPREITIDSVSTCMRPLCRKGKVHEEGMKLNTVRDTGNQVIVWAYGPSEGWQPGHSMLPVSTGHTKLLFKPFTEDEIVDLGKKAGKYVDIFTTLLNLEIETRLRIRNA